MKTTKRLISILLFAAMLMALLCACGTPAQQETAQPEDTQPQEESAQPSEHVTEPANESLKQEEIEAITPSEIIISDPETVVWKVYGEAEDNLDRWQTELNKLLAEKGAKYKVRIEAYGGKIGTKTEAPINDLVSAWESGEQTDVITTDTTGLRSSLNENGKIIEKYVSTYADAVRLGMLISLDDILDSENGQKLKDAIMPEYLERCRICGKIYGLSQRSYPTHATAYNKELLEKYSIDPSTLSPNPLENKETFKRVLEDRGSDEGFCVYWADVSIYATDMWVTGECVAAAFNPKNDRFENVYESEDFKSYINRLYDLKNEGIVKSFYKEQDDFFAVSAGQVKRDDIYEDTYVYSNTKGTAVEKEVVVIPDISRPMIKLFYGDYYTGIASWSQNQDNAFDFVSKLYTDADIANLIVHGVKGEDYELVNGRVVKEGFSQFSTLVNEFLTYPTINESDDKAAYMTAYLNNIPDGQPVGFRFDGKPVSSELSVLFEYWFYKQMTSPLWTFDVADTETAIAQIVKDLNEIGLQKVLDEMNRQYEEWKAGVGLT